MNVLITSAAAKVLLVQSLQAALGSTGKVFTADMTADCAAAYLSDGHFIVGPMARAETMDEILALCIRQGVGLVIPSRDGELPFFAAARDRFREAGIFIHVAAPDIIRLCQNKHAFTHFLIDNGLPPVPCVTVEAGTAFPLFVRPVTGAGGRGARALPSRREWEALENNQDYLVHPVIEAPEYSIDLLMDLEGGKALDAICRERIQVVAGESKISRTVDLGELAALTKRMGETLGLVGHNTVQAFIDPARGPLFIEVNPRFGGASNLSIRAGLDSPRRILQMLGGDVSAYMPRKIAFGATMFRYTQDVITGI